MTSCFSLKERGKVEEVRLVSSVAMWISVQLMRIEQGLKEKRIGKGKIRRSRTEEGKFSFRSRGDWAVNRLPATHCFSSKTELEPIRRS